MLRVRCAYPFDIACIFMRFFGSMLNVGTVTMATLSGYSFFAAGIASSLIALSTFVVGPRVSKLIDEKGQSAIVPLATIISMVGLILMLLTVAFHGSVFILFVGSLLVGCYPSPQAMARARWTYLIRAGKLGDTAPDIRVMFSYESALDDAAFIFGPALSIALSASIHPIAGLLAGGIGFTVGAVLLCLARSTEPTPGWSYDSSSPEKNKAPKKNLMFSSSAVRVLFVLYVFIGAFLALFDTATVSLSEDLHHPDFASLVLMLSGVISMVMGFVFGMVKLRAPLEKQLVLTATAVGVTFGFMFLIDSAQSLMVVALIGATTYAPLLIVANGVCERAVPDSRLTEAITWLSAGYTCGAALGPTLAGVIIDTFGTLASFKVGTLLCVALPLTALLSYRVVKRSIKQSTMMVETRKLS
jgi:hypothetical protein